MIKKELYKKYRDKYRKGNSRSKYLEKKKLARKRYKNKYPDKIRISAKKYRAKKKIKVLTHYSNGLLKCECCGEKEIQFLTIDHINGGGRKHRISEKVFSIIDWLIKKNVPVGFAVLCFNCNCAKGHHGICPHKLKISKN